MWSPHSCLSWGGGICFNAANDRMEAFSTRCPGFKWRMSRSGLGFFWIFSVYAPLQGAACQDIFTRLLLDMVSVLDIQISTLLQDHFKGTFALGGDYSAGEVPAFLRFFVGVSLL